MVVPFWGGAKTSIKSVTSIGEMQLFSVMKEIDPEWWLRLPFPEKNIIMPHTENHGS